MNKARWESLDKDVQQAFRKASGIDFLKKVGQQWSEDDKEGAEHLLKYKRIGVDLTEAQLQDFKKALKPVEERWLKQVSFLGLDGKELISKARQTIKKHSN
jgi:TRAP-type C4-dicarboxylate transport system substrate-binding protein